MMINYDLKFLTCDETVNVKNIDFNSYKYETKKKSEESIYDTGKRSFCERRGGLWRTPRPRVLRELETKLRDRSIVFCEWISDNLITVVFSSGAIAYLTVNRNSLDIQKVLFDRYCVGKLSGQIVTGVVFSTTHLLFTHTDHTATLITFGSSKHTTSRDLVRLAERNPHLQTIELADGARRADRRVSWSERKESGPRVLVWTAAGADPAPWSPAADVRANLHLYQLNGQQMNIIAYHQLENETLSAEVSRGHHNIVHIVQQVTCNKTGVSLEWVCYDIADTEEDVIRLSSHRSGETRVSLPAVARSVRRSPCDLRLLVACIDGTLHVVHNSAGLTHSTRAGFIPSEVSWCGDMTLCAEEGARLQCFDRALTLLQHNAKCIHLAHHCTRDSLQMKVLAGQGIKEGGLLLIMFAGGPLGLLRIMHPRLPLGWIRSGRISRAVAWLRAMDWEHEGDQCLHALQNIANEVYRRPLNANSEAALQAALGTYLATPSLKPAARKYQPAVADLARKYHHHLLRRGRYDKALSLAVDLSAWDLFMDARWSAQKAGRQELADEAATLAEEYASREQPGSECSDSCSCSSHSSCSHSEDSSINCHETKPPPLPRVPIPTLMPVPLHLPETTSTNSIRPNLHQYLERDLTIWNMEVKSNNIMSNNKWHSLDSDLNDTQNVSRHRSLMTIDERANWRAQTSAIDVIPRPHDDNVSRAIGNIYHRGSKEDASSVIYRYQNNFPSIAVKDRGASGSSRHVEKNVKFSDTVTIAVVPEPPNDPEPSRELAESLPICSPHAYLAAFERAPPGTAQDYVEV